MTRHYVSLTFHNWFVLARLRQARQGLSEIAPTEMDDKNRLVRVNPCQFKVIVFTLSEWNSVRLISMYRDIVNLDFTKYHKARMLASHVHIHE